MASATCPCLINLLGKESSKRARFGDRDLAASDRLDRVGEPKLKYPITSIRAGGLSMLSRRDLGKMALGALPIVARAAKKIDSAIHGVQFGVESHIFTGIGLPQDGSVDAMIQTMVE